MKYGMVYFIGLAVALAGAAMVSACSHTPGKLQAAPAGAWSRQTRVPGEYLVTLAEGADGKAIADLYGRFGIKGTKDLGHNIFLVTLTEDPGPAKMEELRG
ncbi:MAG: hypothetical protein E4G97_01655, partial [Deltaproteobacteria bacterium]